MILFLFGAASRSRVDIPTGVRSSGTLFRATERLPIGGPVMSGSLNESEELEQEAWKDCCAAVAGAGRARLGLNTARFGRALVLAASGVRHFLLNRVIGF